MDRRTDAEREEQGTTSMCKMEETDPPPPSKKGAKLTASPPPFYYSTKNWWGDTEWRRRRRRPWLEVGVTRGHAMQEEEEEREPRRSVSEAHTTAIPYSAPPPPPPPPPTPPRPSPAAEGASAIRACLRGPTTRERDPRRDGRTGSQAFTYAHVLLFAFGGLETGGKGRGGSLPPPFGDEKRERVKEDPPLDPSRAAVAAGISILLSLFP